MAPEIGSLTDRVSLSANGSTTSMWARVRSLSSKTRAAQGEPTHTVIVRFRTDVRAGDAFLYRGRRLEIVEADDLDGRRAWLRCLAAERPAA